VRGNGRADRVNRRRGSTGSLTDNQTIGAESYHSTKYDAELANMATSTKDRNGRMGNIQETYYQGKHLISYLLDDAKFVKMYEGIEIAARESKDPMVQLARIAKKTDRFTLYILQILHTLLAGCNIISLVLLPVGDLGSPQGTVNTSVVETSVRVSGAVIPISSEGSVQIPSQTQVSSFF
jgi:hypothetical protein